MPRSSLASSRRSVRAAMAAAALLAISAFFSSAASAGPGYQLDEAKPSITLSAEIPHGIAVDQVSQNLYVTELTTDFFNSGHGQVEQFNSSGTPTANPPFTTGGEDFFAGVAVNPATQGVYAYQTQLTTPFGLEGTSKMTVFSPTGVAGASFTPAKSTGPQLAADSSGRVYFPNDLAGAVQVFSSSGTLEESIACGACAGGAFANPSSVALDSAGNLYVAELGGARRVVKLKPSGGSYAYDSVLQSEEGAVAVGVDPSSGDVFAGDLEGGTYHVVAYDSSGTQFDDFGAETIGPPAFGIETAGQIAANATTHKVYVSDSSGGVVWVFDRVASIPGPLATTSPATGLGQIEATLEASVNPRGHRLTECRFEYTDAADFGVNGFANATPLPCGLRPGGTSAMPISRYVNGLVPGTTYDYRIVTASNGGSANGSAQAFSTLPPLPPTASTGSASAITLTTATIAGSVNPHGGVMSDCHLEYVDEAKFQESGFGSASSKECTPEPEGTTSNPVSAKLTGLTPGTTYRFRVVATNNSGTTEAPDQSFATQTETCANTPSLCPPPQGPPKSTTPAPAPLPPTPGPSAPKPLKCRKGFKKKTVRGKARCVKIKKHRHRH